MAHEDPPTEPPVVGAQSCEGHQHHAPHTPSKYLHLCERCGGDGGEMSYLNKILSGRADIWITAYALLTTREWQGEGNYPSPMDVQALTDYLAGE